jgi:hypothetical protein
MEVVGQYANGCRRVAEPAAAATGVLVRCLPPVCGEVPDLAVWDAGGGLGWGADGQPGKAAEQACTAIRPLSAARLDEVCGSLGPGSRTWPWADGRGRRSPGHAAGPGRTGVADRSGGRRYVRGASTLGSSEPAQAKCIVGRWPAGGAFAFGGTLPRVPLRGDPCTGTAGAGSAVASRFEGREAAHAEPGPVAGHGHERAGFQVLPDSSGQDADGGSGSLRHGKDSSLRRCPVISGHAATVRRSGSSSVRNRLRDGCRHLRVAHSVLTLAG